MRINRRAKKTGVTSLEKATWSTALCWVKALSGCYAKAGANGLDADECTMDMYGGETKGLKKSSRGWTKLLLADPINFPRFPSENPGVASGQTTVDSLLETSSLD